MNRVDLENVGKHCSRATVVLWLSYQTAAIRVLPYYDEVLVWQCEKFAYLIFNLSDLEYTSECSVFLFFFFRVFFFFFCLLLLVACAANHVGNLFHSVHRHCL